MSRAENAISYIRERMEREMPANYHYHNIPHIKDVAEAAERIAVQEGVDAAGRELLKIAAWYHDSGFIKNPHEHELTGCEMVRESLPGFGYNKAEIETVCSLIMATRIPQSPVSHLEKILCDADLDYLGRDDFYTIGDRIFNEFMQRGLVSGRQSWDEMQVRFLEGHRYFTQTAINLRRSGKEKHLAELRGKISTGSARNV